MGLEMVGQMDSTPTSLPLKNQVPVPLFLMIRYGVCSVFRDFAKRDGRSYEGVSVVL